MQDLDPTTKTFVILALWGAAAMFGWVLLRRWRARELARERVWAEDDALDAAQQLDVEDLEKLGWLRRWLFLAGYRRKTAAGSFITATAVALVIGLGCAVFALQSGLSERAVQAASGVPGGVADLARPILLGAPWIFLVIVALVPYSIVSAKRKQRVREVEQDLPVTLELLATMSESGLAFDSALEKVTESGHARRPLFQELRQYQVETLGGTGRVQCFRRLARRIEVPAVTIFVSALVQAEQIGSGFTAVLRNQADDLRNRRREEANMLAQSLTVKLVFPLVLCFLPGIFVTTLGPVFLQFLKMTESLSQGR